MASRSNSSANFLWAILLCCFLFEEGAQYSDVKLEVLVTRFSNPQNRNALKQCCDGKKDGTICPDYCDIFFSINISQSHGPPISKTSPLVLGNASEFSSQENLTSLSKKPKGNFLSVDFKWTSWIVTQFSISFYDNDSRDGAPSLGNRSSYEEVIKYTQALPKTINSSVQPLTFSENNVSFELQYRLKCKKYYYGELCNILCVPRSDSLAHTMCLENGTKICRPGWTPRPYCNKPICPGDCNGNGVCLQPDVCSCHPGWRGTSCDECIPRKSCLHATCKSPHGSCVCKSNWTGQNCDVDMFYCSHYDPCANRGTCIEDYKRNFTCACQEGWFGTKCETSLCPSCNLTRGFCTQNRECSCHAGWKGPDCNVALTECTRSTGCIHGYCIRPFECLCKEGWTGKNCNESVNITACGQQNPCDNDGSCVDVAPGNYRCDCKRGFTGRRCKEKVPSLSCSKWCNESRGYCKDNECRCHSGWEGLNCSECIKNSSCVNGYCRRPFECICNDSWTGTFCNIPRVQERDCKDNVSQCDKTKRLASNDSISDKQSQNALDIDRLVYILSSVSVVLILACLLYLVWRQHRRRASFHVQSSTVVANELVKPSYRKDNARQVSGHERNGVSLNNNIAVKTDFTSYPSSEIVLNPMLLQPSQNSRSTLLHNSPDVYEQHCEGNPPNTAEYCII